MAPLRVIFSLVLLLGVMLQAAPSWAQSFEEGLRALRDDEATRAEEIWLALADRGDGQAQYALGTLYEQGHPGVPQDIAKAVIWYQKAAEQGVAAAENNLALIYATGRGVDRDPTNALRLWLSAANKGHVQAQYNAGLAFFRGSGVERDIGRASQLFQKAATGGLADSQYALAQMYRLGIGVQRNPRTSLFWYQQAAAQGHASSQREAQELREAGVVLDDESETTRLASAGGQGQAASTMQEPAAKPEQAASKSPVPAQPSASQVAQPAKAEPAKAEPAKAEPAKTEPAKAQPAKSATQQAAKPQTGAAAAPSGSYGLWVGSASDRAAAQKIWGDLHGRGFSVLSEKASRIEPPKSGGDALRVYATAWPDRASAVAACLDMKEADPAIFCAPVALK